MSCEGWQVEAVTLATRTGVRLGALTVVALVISGSLTGAALVYNGAVPNGAAPNGPTANGQGPNGSPSNSSPSNGYASITPVPLGAEGLNFNALLTNRNALPIVVGQQLGPGLFADQYIHLQLADADARGVFRYMYGCACAAGQSFSVPEGPQQPRSAATTYVGEVGLAPGWCGKGGPARISQRQLELVSACVAGRVNVRGNVTAVSLRNPEEARTYQHDAVFQWREAAFFGNIFSGPDDWVEDVQVLGDGVITGKNQRPPKWPDQQSAFPNMFSCVSARWSDGAAYANARLCSADNGCVGNVAGMCVGQCTSSPRDAHGHAFELLRLHRPLRDHLVGPADELCPRSVRVQSRPANVRTVESCQDQVIRPRCGRYSPNDRRANRGRSPVRPRPVARLSGR